MDVGDCGAGFQEGDVGEGVDVRVDVDDGGGHGGERVRRCGVELIVVVMGSAQHVCWRMVEGGDVRDFSLGIRIRYVRGTTGGTYLKVECSCS